MIPRTEHLAQDADWLRLIGRLSASALAHDFLSRFPAVDLFTGKVSAAELVDTSERVMAMYLTLLSGDSLAPDDEQFPASLGRRRARQGVPLDQETEGIRTSALVFWNALRNAADLSLTPALVRNTDTVLGLIEWNAREVQRAYLQEEARRSLRNERLQQRALTALFGPRAPGRDDIEFVAAALGLPEDTRIDLLVQPGHHPEPCPICQRHGREVLAYADTLHTRHFGPAEGRDLVEGVASPHSAALIPGIAGLAGLRDADRACIAMLRARPGPGEEPVRLESGWKDIAWAGLTAEVPPSLLPIRLDDLLALSPTRRERLLETVGVFLATGSIKETSERLFCHRNTVVKRLAQFEALTGIDLGVPDQAALASLTLAGLTSAPARTA